MERLKPYLRPRFLIPTVYGGYCLVILIAVVVTLAMLSGSDELSREALLSGNFAAKGQSALEQFIIIMFISPLTALILLVLSLRHRKKTESPAWYRKLPLILTIISQVPLLTALFYSVKLAGQG